MKKTAIKNIIAFGLFLAALLSFVVYSSRIVTPKRYEYGANFGAFAQEEKDSFDVLFFGSSLVYCNLIPSVIYDDSGISGYILAGPYQTTAMTYYYVRQALKTQQPQAVFVEVSNVLFNDEPGLDDANMKVNLCYYPYNADRIAATMRLAPEKDRLGLLFPLYAYHDRWQDLSEDDWRIGLHGYTPDLLAGYTFLSDTEPQSSPRLREFEQTDAEYQRNLQWLEKIAALCREKNVKCIFYITANYAFFESSYRDRLESDLLSTGADFQDHTAVLDELSLRPEADFKDFQHFNYLGAEKYSHKMANILQDVGVRPQHKNDAAWQNRSEYYHQRIAQISCE